MCPPIFRLAVLTTPHELVQLAFVYSFGRRSQYVHLLPLDPAYKELLPQRYLQMNLAPSGARERALAHRQVEILRAFLLYQEDQRSWGHQVLESKDRHQSPDYV